MRFCDYCGDELTGNVEAVAFGHSEGHLRNCTADKWFYYCEGECTDRIRRMLEDTARFANLEQGVGLVWRLEGLPRATEPEAEPEAEEAPKPVVAPVKGTATLDGIELGHGAAAALRRGGIRTLEEAAEFSEVELLGLDGVGVTTARAVIGGLDAQGLALREGATPEQLGQRIRRLREMAGLRRSEVARGIDPKPDERGHHDIYESHIANWEAARQVPTAEQLERLAEFFQVPAGALTVAEAG